MAHHKTSAERIAELNDEFRLSGRGGSRYITAGIQAKGSVFVLKAIAAVMDFNAFDEDNDPYGQHDFGCVTVEGQKLFWKIDYYDRDRKYGSEDPADQFKTHRVLTIMYSNEY